MTTIKMLRADGSHMHSIQAWEIAPDDEVRQGHHAYHCDLALPRKDYDKLRQIIYPSKE